MKLINYVYYLSYASYKKYPSIDAKEAARTLPGIVFASVSISICWLLYNCWFMLYQFKYHQFHLVLVFAINIVVTVVLFNVLYVRTTFYKNIEQYYQEHGRPKYATLLSGLIALIAGLGGLAILVAISFWGHSLQN